MILILHLFFFLIVFQKKIHTFYKFFVLYSYHIFLEKGENSQLFTLETKKGS